MEHSRPRRLTRSDDRILGGVAAGLGEYLDIDPTIVRVVWVLAVVFGLPLAVIGYIVLWLIMPGPEAARGEGTTGDVEPAATQHEPGRDNGALILGLVLIVVGALFFLPDFDLLPWFGWQLIHLTWPILLILGGLLLLMRSGRPSS
jgi:phage shock protein C